MATAAATREGSTKGREKSRTLEIGAELHLGPAPANCPHRSVPAHAFGAARQLARDHGLGREVAGRGSAARRPRRRRRRDGGCRGLSRLSRAETLRPAARADCRERRRRRGASGAADFERAHDPRLSGAPLGVGSQRRDGCRRGGRHHAAGLGGVGTAPALLRGPVRFGPAGRTLADARRRGAPAPPPGGRVRLRAGLRRVVRGRLLRRGRQSRAHLGRGAGRLPVPLALRGAGAEGDAGHARRGGGSRHLGAAPRRSLEAHPPGARRLPPVRA